MQLFNSRRRKVLSTVAVCAVAGIATLAVAAWLTEGIGQGSAKVGEITAPTVVAGTATGTITPGNTGPGSFRVTSPASNGPLVLYATAPSFGGLGTSSNPAACPSENLSPTNRAGLAIDVPTGTNEITVPDAFRLSPDAPQACAGETLTYEARLSFKTP